MKRSAATYAICCCIMLMGATTMCSELPEDDIVPEENLGQLQAKTKTGLIDYNSCMLPAIIATSANICKNTGCCLNECTCVQVASVSGPSVWWEAIRACTGPPMKPTCADNSPCPEGTNCIDIPEVIKDKCNRGSISCPDGWAQMVVDVYKDQAARDHCWNIQKWDRRFNTHGLSNRRRRDPNLKYGACNEVPHYSMTNDLKDCAQIHSLGLWDELNPGDCPGWRDPSDGNTPCQSYTDAKLIESHARGECLAFASSQDTIASSGCISKEELKCADTNKCRQKFDINRLAQRVQCDLNGPDGVDGCKCDLNCDPWGIRWSSDTTLCHPDRTSGEYRQERLDKLNERRRKAEVQEEAAEKDKEAKRKRRRKMMMRAGLAAMAYKMLTKKKKDEMDVLTEEDADPAQETQLLQTEVQGIQKIFDLRTVFKERQEASKYELKRLKKNKEQVYERIKKEVTAAKKKKKLEAKEWKKKIGGAKGKKKAELAELKQAAKAANKLNKLKIKTAKKEKRAYRRKIRGLQFQVNIMPKLVPAISWLVKQKMAEVDLGEIGSAGAAVQKWLENFTGIIEEVEKMKSMIPQKELQQLAQCKANEDKKQQDACLLEVVKQYVSTEIRRLVQGFTLPKLAAGRGKFFEILDPAISKITAPILFAVASVPLVGSVLRIIVSEAFQHYFAKFKNRLTIKINQIGTKLIHTITNTAVKAIFGEAGKIKLVWKKNPALKIGKEIGDGTTEAFKATAAKDEKKAVAAEKDATSTAWKNAEKEKDE